MLMTTRERLTLAGLAFGGYTILALTRSPLHAFLAVIGTIGVLAFARCIFLLVHGARPIVDPGTGREPEDCWQARDRRWYMARTLPARSIYVARSIASLKVTRADRFAYIRLNELGQLYVCFGGFNGFAMDECLEIWSLDEHEKLAPPTIEQLAATEKRLEQRKD